MMVLLNLIFIAVVLVVIAGVLFVPFLLLWWGLITWRKPKRRWLWWLAAFPAFGIVFMIGVVVSYLWFTRPAAVFEMALGFSPPASVHQIESSQFILGDSGSRYLQFTADPAVGQRIITNGSWQRIDKLNAHTNHPVWWNPSTRPSIELYEQDLTGQMFSTVEKAYLWFDPTTGEVWYWWYGID